MRLKNIKNILNLIITAILLLFSNYSISQTFSTANVKMAYIYNFGKYIEWEDIKNNEFFRIGVLGNDTDIINRLNFLKINYKVKNKPIKIIHFTNYQQITKTEILYVLKELNYQIDTIYQKIKNNNTLLVTDDNVTDKTMINFIYGKNTLNFQINDKNIHNARLTIAPKLIAMSKSKTELKNLYIETESKLKSEKLTVEKQKEEINIQRNIITSQNKEIDKRKLEIEHQNIKISQQIEKIKQKNTQLNYLSNEINNQQSVLDQRLLILNKQEKKIKSQISLIKNQRTDIERRTNKLNELNNNIALQQKKIDSQKIISNEQVAKIKGQRVALYIFIVVILLVSIFVLFINRSYKIIKLSKKRLEEKNAAIQIQNHEIAQQKEELQSQRDEIQEQNSILKRVFNNIKIKNRELTDSIKYAQRIQQSIFPTDNFINEFLPNSFILFQPKEILSGDFYFIKQNNLSTDTEKIIISAVDCTGHGVPGALMSIVGKDLLDHSITELGLSKPSEILESLNIGINNTFKQDTIGYIAKDGMDIALITIEKNTKKLEFAGAKNPIYLIRNNSLSIFKGDIYEIGNTERKKDLYTNHEIQLQKNDIIYLFSDGYPDQFGGDRGKKFKHKTFQELLLKIHQKPLLEQKNTLYNEFIEWKGNQEQIDDVLVIGIKI